MKKTEVMTNPFFDIEHKGDEDIILNKQNIAKIKEITKELVKKSGILLISGEHGSGKSLVENEIECDLPKSYKIKKFEFSKDLEAELRGIPLATLRQKKLIVEIDHFELSEVIDDHKLKRILDMIEISAKSGVGYILSCTPETLERIQEVSPSFKRTAKVYRTPSFTFEQAKQIVISRLNAVRHKKSNSIEPFTEYQLKSVWNKSNGNPKMILLLCGTLYDALNS